MSSGRGLLVLCLVLIGLAIELQGQNTAKELERRLGSVKNEEKVDLLNRLTYEYITIDNNKVLTYNHQAIELSQKLGYTKGEGVAYTYKGVFEYMSGQFPEAHQDLHTALALSHEVQDRDNLGYIYLQLGNLGLEEVETDSALLYFSKAHQIFKDSLNPESLSKVYRNLSAVYGQRFQYEEQDRYLDKAIVIRRLLPDKILLTDALALKANNLIRLGKLKEAEAVLNEGDSIVKDEPHFEEDKNDLRHLRALLLFQRGNFEQAVVLADSARNYFFRASLFRKYVTLLTDIGEVFSNRGEYELALNNLYAGLRLSKLRGFESETYTLRNRIGWINFQLGDYNQALRLANESLGSKPKRLLKVDLANALNLKGVALTEMENLPEAKIWLDSALTIYRRMGNDRGTSETLMNIAYLVSRQKRYPEALALYRQSIELAEATDYTYGLAWSSWGLGDIYFRQGDYKTAAVYLDKSEEYSRKIEANEILIINFNTRRDVLAAQRKFEEALKYSRMASQLKDSIHRSDLVRRFVNLEKIQEIEQRDRDIKALQKDKQLAEDKVNLQESKLELIFIWLVLGIVSIVLLGVLAFVYYRFYARIKLLNITITNKNKDIQAQANQMQELNMVLKELYDELSEQNEEIQAQANKLSDSNRNISDLNRNLERIVEEKTQELRTTNAELIKYNNELLQFSYTVSHNLRGPVARLLGLSALAHAEQEFSKAKEWLGLMNRTASDLDLVIKDLSKILDLRNERHEHREMVDFEKEWRRSINLLQESLKGDEIIESDFSSLPEVMTVRAVIQSIFYNLLSTELTFRSDDLKLKVTAFSRI